MQPHAAPIQGAGMVLFLAQAQADEHRVIAGDHLPVLLCEPSASWPQSCAASRHPRNEETCPLPRRAGGGPVPISGHPTPPAPATTPPGSCKRQGQTVIPDLATSTPNHRSYEEGNGRVGGRSGAPVERSTMTDHTSTPASPGLSRRTMLAGAAAAMFAAPVTATALAQPAAALAQPATRTTPSSTEGTVHRITMYVEELGDGQVGYGLEPGK